jgi:hypothetical protein
MRGHVGLFGRKAGPYSAILLTVVLFLSSAPPPSGSGNTDIAALFRQIRDEVLGLDKYPGEDFHRGEFFLGPGDDDTYKTHAVGILVRGEAGGSRMTIVISRLEPSRGDPRTCYARDPKTIDCRFRDGKVEVLRSDYPAGELEELLPVVLKAVVDKKNLLKLIKPPADRFISP